MRPAMGPKRSTTTSRTMSCCSWRTMLAYSTVNEVATLTLPPALVVVALPNGARKRLVRTDEEMLSLSDIIARYSARSACVDGVALFTPCSSMIDRRSRPRCIWTSFGSAFASTASEIGRERSSISHRTGPGRSFFSMVRNTSPVMVLYFCETARMRIWSRMRTLNPS